MATADLTASQLNTAATATMTIAQAPKPTSPWTGCRVTFYQADANAGANANKLVAEVYVGDGGASVVIAADDVVCFAAAEITGIPTMLKRAVVEARARKGAA